MTDLLHQEYLDAVVSECGKDPKEWNGHVKVDVIEHALFQCNNYERLEECMRDFWKDHKLKLVTSKWSLIGLWELIEPEIIEQIERLRDE